MPILCEPGLSARDLIHASTATSMSRIPWAARPSCWTTTRRDPGRDRPAVPASAMRWRSARRCGWPGPRSASSWPAGTVDITLLTRALQSGVREVVPAGDHGALAAACRRSYEVSRRMLAPRRRDEQRRARSSPCSRPREAAERPRWRSTSAWRWPGRPAASASSTSTWRSATWRSASSSTRLRTMVDALPMAGHLDITGAAVAADPLPAGARHAAGARHPR